MTPEQLEEIPDIGDEMVEKIQQAVLSYYGQFEETPAEASSDEAPAQEASAVEESGTEDLQEGSVTIENQEIPAMAETLEKEPG